MHVPTTGTHTGTQQCTVPRSACARQPDNVRLEQSVGIGELPGEVTVIELL
jgi:hypothetical protein